MNSALPMRNSRRVLRTLPVLALALLAPVLAFETTARATSDDSAPKPAQLAATDSGLYVKVLLSTNIKMSKLKPGNVVEGTLARDVYAADRKLFPAGEPVRLTVDHLERRRRTPNDHWPGVVKLFTPRHENYPVFKSATFGQAAEECSLQVNLISVSRMREVYAKAKKNKSGQATQENGAVDVSHSNAKNPATPTMVLEAFGGETTSASNDLSSQPAVEARPSESEVLPLGTRSRILLLGNVSASKSKPGDVIQARVLEPVLLNSQVILPAGSMFEGRVVKNTPPRWLSRSGSLYLTFTKLTLPGGQNYTVAASLAGAELDRRSHTRMDAEGRLHGERPGKAWMAINLGVTAGLAKEADDTVQLIIEAIVSSATDASTAGTARIIASCVSGIYMATRRGRDVVLPRFTEMDLSLDRPVSLKPDAGSSSGIAGGK